MAKLAARRLLQAFFDALSSLINAISFPEHRQLGQSHQRYRVQSFVGQVRRIKYEKATFPWAASGRALGTGRREGLTKLLADKDTKRILGAGMVGPNAGELIAEAVLALEMGADAEDVSLTIHPHPTLSETFAFAAEMIEGSITDILVKK